MTPEFFPPGLPWEVLDRYVRGEGTPDDIQVVETAFANTPLGERSAVLYRQWLIDRHHYPAATSPDQAWERVRHAVDRAPSRTREIGGHAEGGPGRRLTRQTWRRLAFGAAIAGAIALVATTQNWMARFTGRSSHEALEHRYVTTTGQRATVTLRDGSRITLAPESQLQVSNAFGARDRRVFLRGEAYFEVHSMGSAPFVVETRGTTTRVLGTIFEIRHYPTDPHVQVTVVSGKVSAGGPRASILLTAGMSGRITDSTATATRVTEVDASSAWINGRLVFEKTPILDMLATVGRWYGYRFQLADSLLAADRVTTVLRIGDRARTLAAIEVLLNVTMTFDGPTVTLHPRRTPTTGSIRKAPYSDLPISLEAGK